MKFLALIVLLFLVSPVSAANIICFDRKAAERELTFDQNEQLFGVGVTWDGKCVVKFFLSSNGKFTIGVVPSNSDMFCPVVWGVSFERTNQARY